MILCTTKVLFVRWRERPMAEAGLLTVGLMDRSLSESAPIECLHPSRRGTTVAQFPTLPTFERGQPWWVDLSTEGPQFAPFESQALQTASVVVYDRGLVRIVTRLLPLGSYAEPAAANDGGSDTALERCLQFVRDGWSVVRLIDHEATSE